MVLTLTRKRFAFLLIAILLLQQDLIPVANAAVADERYSSIAKAELLCREKVAAWTVTPGDNSDYIAVALESLAALYSENGRNDDAISKYKEALAVREKAPNPAASFIAVTQIKLADCLSRAHRDEESEPLLLAAYTTQAKLLGKDNPEIQKTKRKLAVCYLEQKKFAAAEILFKELLQTVKEHSDRTACGHRYWDELLYARQLTDLSDCYMREKKWDIAIPLSEQLLFIYQNEAVTRDEPISLPSALLTMATCYSESGQCLRAEPLFEQASHLIHSLKKPYPAYQAIILTKHGKNLAALGKFNEAESLYRQALSNWKSVNKPGDGDKLETIEAYTALLRKTNRLDEAQKQLAQAAVIKKKPLTTRLPLPKIFLETSTIELGGPIYQERTLIPPN